MARDIDDEVTDGEPLRVRLVPPAQPRSDPGNELLRLERLHDIVLSAPLQTHGIRAVGDVVHLHALVAQYDSQHLRQRQVVVDDQHATLHVGQFLSARFTRGRISLPQRSGKGLYTAGQWPGRLPFTGDPTALAPVAR